MTLSPESFKKPEFKPVATPKSREARRHLRLVKELGSHETVRALDGTDREEIAVGGFENTEISARVGADGEVRFRTASEAETEARKDVAKTFVELQSSFYQALDATLRSSEVPAEKQAALRERIASDMTSIISDAAKTKKPNRMLMDLLQEDITRHTKRERDFLELKSQHRAAVEQARTAEKTHDNAALKEAETQIYTLEQQILEAQARLLPSASPAEKQVQVDRMEGFVFVIPEAIYNQGIDKVKARLQTLETQMREADKSNDQPAWETARDEYDRHRAVMPILERAEKIRDVETETQRLAQEAMDKKILDKKNALGKIWGHTGRFQRSRKELAEAVKAIEDALRELDKKPATKEAEANYAALDQDRKFIAEKLREVEGKIKTLADERDRLKSVEVSLDINEQPVVAAKTDLYFELGNIYRDKPDVIVKYLGGALAGRDISEGTRDILTTFQRDLLAGRLNEVIPESEIVADDEEEYNIEPEPTVLTSKIKLDKMAKGLETVRPIPTIPESEIVADDNDEKEYGFGAPEVTRRVTPLRTEAVRPEITAPEEIKKGRPRMKAQEIDVPADVLEPTVEPPKDSDKALEEALARFNEAFPPRPSVEETSQIPRPGPKTERYVPPTLVNEDDEQLSLQRQQGDLWQEANKKWDVNLRDSKSVESALIRLQGKMPDVADLSNLYRDFQDLENAGDALLNQETETDESVSTESVPAEEQFYKPTGLELLESALHSFGSVDAAQDTLIGLGLPKNIFNKIKTSDDLWNLYNNPSFWMKISGQADKVRNAVDLFIQQASTTAGGLSKTAGAEMRNKRDQDQKKGGRAKGGLVN